MVNRLCALVARPGRAARQSGRACRGAVHLRFRRQTQRRGALASRHPVQHRADPRGDRLLAVRQIHDFAAAVSCLRLYLRRHHAAGDRLENVPLPVATALPHHPRDHLRPRLHGVVRHQHFPRQLCALCPPVRFLQAALRRGRGGEAQRQRAHHLDGQIRHPHSGRLRRHRMRAGAGGEHADGVPRWQRWALVAGSEIQTGSGAWHYPGRPAQRARPERDAGLLPV